MLSPPVIADHEHRPGVGRRPWAALQDALFGTGSKQRIGLQRTALSGAIYLAASLLRFMLAGLGLLQWHVAFIMAGYEMAGFIVLYAVLRSGISLRFRDPALTLWQILLGLSALVANYALVPISRDVTMPLLCLVLVFGMYRLTPTQMLLAGGSAVVMLLAMLLSMAYLDRSDFDLTQQALNVALAAATLPVFVVVARQVARVRHGQVQQKTEMAEAIQQLHHLATHDGLTGLVNRRYMSSRLHDELQRMARSQRPFSVLILDVDHFKRINDSFGHQAGDSVLISLARQLVAAFPDPDSASRWGGEEFLVLMPEATAEDMQRVAGQLRDKLEILLPARNEAQPSRVTFSGGVAQAQPGEPLQRLLERADAALYRAKQGGRDQVLAAQA